MYTITKIRIDSIVIILMVFNLIYGFAQYLAVLLGYKNNVSLAGMAISDIYPGIENVYLIIPILVAAILGGFILGSIFGAILNLLLKWTGGIKLEMKHI